MEAPMSASVATARSFVSASTLPEAPATRDGAPAAAIALDFDAGRSEAWVVGSQIFSFVEGVSAERRRAITNSALFASLVANRAQGLSQTEDWFLAYADALNRLGWVTEEQIRREFAQGGTSVDVHEAVIEFAGALGVSGGALALVTAALSAMKKVSGNQPWITLFEKQTHAQEVQGFQIGLVEQEADGRFQVKLMNFALSVKQTQMQVLFVKFANFDLRMNSIGRRVTIDEDVLGAVTPDLVKRLAGYTRSYIAEVGLPDLPLPG
jgi:hypothetical protein